MKDRKSILLTVSLFVISFVLVFMLSASGSYGVYYAESKRELPIYSVEIEEKKISISFDCAWGVEYTDKLLEEMEKHNVKCTFFAVQFWTEKYPEYVKKIIEKGHEIGTHSATHSHMSKMSIADIEKELKESSKAIEDITNKPVKLFRPPFGEYNDNLIKTTKNCGLEAIQWDVDSLDWKNLSANEIAMRVISRTKKGSIILCHNNGLHTAEALPLIFADLIGKGYTFVPISELILSGDYKIDENGRQYACN